MKNKILTIGFLSFLLSPMFAFSQHVLVGCEDLENLYVGDSVSSSDFFFMDCISDLESLDMPLNPNSNTKSIQYCESSTITVYKFQFGGCDGWESVSESMVWVKKTFVTTDR